MIGPTANLEAAITADEVLVRGTVKGEVRAKRGIEVGNEGSVIGDVTTRQVFIKEGAWFKGSIQIEQSSQPVYDHDGSQAALPKAAAAIAGCK